MLYEGAIRFSESAKDALQQGDHFVKNTNLQKAQNILIELLSSLDRQKGQDVAKNLHNIYQFLYQELIRVNIEDDAKGLENCIRILRNLLESWCQLEAQQRNSREDKSHVA
jgi:flagellar protein FliS